MTANSHSLRRSAAISVITLFMAVATITSGTPARASTTVTCHSVNFQVNSPTNGHGNDPSGSIPVHMTGPYGDCPVAFYAPNSQNLVLKCWLDNQEFGKRWLYVTYVGGTQSGWVYRPYLTFSSLPGHC